MTNLQDSKFGHAKGTPEGGEPRKASIKYGDLIQFEEYMDHLTKGKEPGKVRIVLE